MLKPVLTEKTIEKAKGGKFTFLVDNASTKYQVREMVSKAFGVKVVSVRTANKKSTTRRAANGKFVTKKAVKRVVVDVVEADRKKIDVFGGEN